MYCMSKRQVQETVAIRFPKGLWHQVRLVAMSGHETGMAWLVRAAHVALGSVAEKTDVGERRVGQVVIGPIHTVERPEDLVSENSVTRAAVLLKNVPVMLPSKTGVLRSVPGTDLVRPTPGVVGPSQPTGARRSTAGNPPASSGPDLKCPKCGCNPSCHRTGTQKNRCQAHPTCVWADVPEDLF